MSAAVVAALTLTPIGVFLLSLLRQDSRDRREMKEPDNREERFT